MRKQAENRRQIQKVNLRRKKKQKIKINSSRDKTDERKEYQKESGVLMNQNMNLMTGYVLHANDDNELAGKLNNIFGTNKESEGEDSDSGLKSSFKSLTKMKK